MAILLVVGAAVDPKFRRKNVNAARTAHGWLSRDIGWTRPFDEFSVDDASNDLE